MQNPFDATNQVRNQVNVNNFDWTFNNNLTMEIGVVTPCFCELVPNKTGIRIQPAAAMHPCRIYLWDMSEHQFQCSPYRFQSGD